MDIWEQNFYQVKHSLLFDQLKRWFAVYLRVRQMIPLVHDGQMVTGS